MIEINQVELNNVKWIPTAKNVRKGRALLIEAFRLGNHFIRYETTRSMHDELYNHGIIKILRDLEYHEIADEIEKTNEYKLDGNVVKVGEELLHDDEFKYLSYMIFDYMRRFKYGESIIQLDFIDKIMNHKPFQKDYLEGKLYKVIHFRTETDLDEISKRLLDEILTVTK